MQTQVLAVFNSLFATQPVVNCDLKILGSSQIDLDLEQLVETFLLESNLRCVEFPKSESSKVFRTLTHLSAAREFLTGGLLDVKVRILVCYGKDMPDSPLEKVRLFVKGERYEIKAITDYLGIGKAMVAVSC